MHRQDGVESHIFVFDDFKSCEGIIAATVLMTIDVCFSSLGGVSDSTYAINVV